MKKRFVVILLMLLFPLLYVNVSASELDDYIYNNPNPHPLENGQYCFDYIKAIDNEDEFIQSNYYKNLQKFVLDEVRNGSITYYGSVALSNSSFSYKVVLDIYNNQLNNLYLYLNDVMFYNVTLNMGTFDFRNGCYSKVIGNKNVNVGEVLGSQINITEYSKKELFNENNIKFLTLGFINGYLAKSNEKYNEEIYLYVENTNAYSIDKLLCNIKFLDNDCIDEYQIVDNNYNPDNKNYIPCGSYSFTIVACDNNSNVVYQKCSVKSVDIKGPDIKGPDSFSIELNKQLSEEDILNEYDIEDISDVKSTSIDMSNYSLNYNKLGTYKVSITAIDNYDNKNVKEIDINVVDEEAPIVIVADFNLYSSKQYTIDDIKKYIYIYDNSLSYTFTLTDVDGLFQDTTPHEAKKYNFEVVAKDSSLNTTTYKFCVNCYDDIFPSIDLDEIRIMVPSSKNITKEMLISMLNQTSEDTVVDCTTSYLTILEEGKYDITLKYIDEREIDKKLVVINTYDDGIIYGPKVTTKKESNIAFYIVASISIVVLGTSLVLIIIVRKKSC